MNIEELKQKMDEARYIYDDTLALPFAAARGIIPVCRSVGRCEICQIRTACIMRNVEKVTKDCI